MEPVDSELIQQQTEGIYEAIAVVAKRARQINDEMKAILVRELAEVASPEADTGEEKEYNYDKMRISKSFDRYNPIILAVDEKLKGDVDFRYREIEEGEAPIEEEE